MFYPVLTASFTYLYRSTQNRGSFEQAHRMRLVLYRFVTQGKGFLGQVWLLLSQNTYWRLSQKKSWETLEFYPPNSRKSFLFRYTTLFLIARGRYYVNFRRTTHFHRSYMKVIRVAFSWWASRIFVVRSTLFQCFLLLSFFLYMYEEGLLWGRKESHFTKTSKRLWMAKWGTRVVKSAGKVPSSAFRPDFEHCTCPLKFQSLALRIHWNISTSLSQYRNNMIIHSLQNLSLL